MRQIGTIDNLEQAAQFAAYLTANGTNCSVQSGPAGQIIWVQEEDRVASAREELNQYLNNPAHERYADAGHRAATVLRERRHAADAIRRRTIDVRKRWNRPDIAQGPVSAGMMALMILLSAIKVLSPERYAELLPSLYFVPAKIQEGEIWRLIAPIFLHGDLLHFLFNFLCLRDFGLLIESRIGSPRYLSMVLVIAVASNTAQFAVAGPHFVGMSGVIYGLFGYIWMKSKLDPKSGFWMSGQTVTMMMGWFLLCVFVIPGIANGAHLFGLLAGVVMGSAGPVWRSFTGQR